MASWTPTAVLERLLKVDPGVARVLLVGLSVLAAIALVGAWQIEPARVLPTFLWLAGGYVVFAFLANMPGWIGQLLGGLACFGFIAYLGLFAVQLVAQNILTPPVMAAGCFFNPGVQGCPLNVIPAAETRAAATLPERPPADTTAVERTRELGPDALDLSTYRVFVQFSPSRLGEDSVDALIQTMISNGWVVEPTPEALPSAFGLNEVRYFHPDDRAAAERLAAAVQRIAPWSGEVRVRDFTRLSDTAPEGLLEIWTSA